jgi:hypothetical protein
LINGVKPDMAQRDDANDKPSETCQKMMGLNLPTEVSAREEEAEDEEEDR